MKVTEVKIFPFDPRLNLGLLQALASVVIDDCLLLRGLRIMDGPEGPYVGYPNDPFYKGEEYKTIYSPISKELRDEIENAVLEKFQEEKEK